VYIHKVNWIMHFRDMAIWSFQNGRQPPSWIWSNWKWHRSIRHPRKPHPRTKHKVDRTTRCWDVTIWSFQNGRWPPSWIWSNWKWCRSIRRTQQPHPRTKRMTCCRVMDIWNFPKCVNRPWGRSLVIVGRQYSYFLHWSHMLLFRYVRNVAHEE